MSRLSVVFTACVVSCITVACESATSTPAATRLSVSVQPNGAFSGLPFNTQPIVRVTDDGGRVIGSAPATTVTVRLASGDGTLAGPTSATTVGGVATFAGLRIDGAGSHGLVFEAAGLRSSETILIAVPQLPNALHIDVPPAQAFSGRAFRSQPRVSVRDHAGLVIESSRAPIVANIRAGSGRLAGTTTVAAFDGVAQFANLAIVGTGEHSLEFAMSGGITRASDPLVVSPPADLLAKDISAAVHNACAVATDGTPYCWGANQKGQLGRNSVEIIATRTMIPVSGGKRFETISVGFAHSCAVDVEQQVWCWGSEENGAIGSTAIAPVTSPRLVPSSSRFDQVVSGSIWSCARAVDGVVHCWGDNTSGELGIGSFLPRVGPAPIANAQRFLSVNTGRIRPCALETSGQAYCWGFSVSTPTLIDSAPRFVKLVPGPFDMCGQAVDDRWYCKSPENVAVRDTVLQPFVTAVRGTDHVCALDASGLAYCWGNNEFGQLGDGTTQSTGIPRAVLGGHRFAQLAAGWGFSCGRTMASLVFCWGHNNTGQLGDSTAIDRLLPTKVVPP